MPPDPGRSTLHLHVPGHDPVDLTDAIEAARSVDEDVLTGYVERLETLTRERMVLADDIRELLEEARAKRLNPKALKEIVKRRLETSDQAAARQAVAEAVDLYLLKLRPFETTPLGRHAGNGNGAHG